MPINKNDTHARGHWGDEIYDAIPKSVFATVAWHLANIASGELDNPGAAESRFAEELRAMVANRIIPEPQAKRGMIMTSEAAYGKGFLEEVE